MNDTRLSLVSSALLALAVGATGIATVAGVSYGHAGAREWLGSPPAGFSSRADSDEDDDEAADESPDDEATDEDEDGDDHCRIDGVTYDAGELDPDNRCQACRTEISRRSWSAVDDGRLCDDGSACTTEDTCQAGACTGGLPAACDDENICTVDSCDDAVGCVNEYVGDGNACEMWVTDGSILDIALLGDTLYLAGLFDWVSPTVAGSFVPLDRNTAGLKDGFAAVDGAVFAAVPDGAGGWFIGGSFERIGRVARRQLAHILADGSVADWGPCDDQACIWSPEDGGMGGIALGEGVVYVGGVAFLSGSVTQSGVARFDATTGQMLPWTPDPAIPNVSKLVLHRGTLYLAAGNQLVAVDAATGATLDVKKTNGPVNALAVYEETLYVGGWFETIDGLARGSLAAVDLTTGLVTPWNPGATGLPGDDFYRVSAFAVEGDTLYAAGAFRGIGGAPRNGLAAFDAKSGILNGWDPDVPVPAFRERRAVTASGGRVYLGHRMTTTTESPVAAVDRTTGALLDWTPPLHGLQGDPTVVNVIVAGADAIWVGGDPSTFGGVRRHRLAAIDVRTGQPTDWNPNADCFRSAPRTATQIEVADQGVFVASAFTDTGNFSTAVEALDPTSGSATCLLWSTALLSPSGGARVLALGGDTLYAGTIGGFTVGGKVRALDVATGALTSWEPDILFGGTSTVDEIAALGDVAYLGGRFTSVNGELREYLAAVDAVTGLTLPWDPAGEFFGSTIMPIYSLAANDGQIYTAGRFTAIGGQVRSGLAALDPVTGLASAWDPGFDKELPAWPMSFDDGVVYLGLRAAVDAASGALLPWVPSSAPSTFVFEPVTSTARDGVVFLGADAPSYAFVGGQLRSGIAAVAGVSWTTSPTPPRALPIAPRLPAKGSADVPRRKTSPSRPTPSEMSPPTTRRATNR